MIETIAREVVDDGPAQEIEQAQRRIVRRSNGRAEQQRIACAISGGEFDLAIADQVALLGRRPDIGCRPCITDPVRLQSGNDQNAGRRKRERLGIADLELTRSL